MYRLEELVNNARAVNREEPVVIKSTRRSNDFILTSQALLSVIRARFATESSLSSVIRTKHADAARCISDKLM